VVYSSALSTAQRLEALLAALARCGAKLLFTFDMYSPPPVEGNCFIKNPPCRKPYAEMTEQDHVANGEWLVWEVLADRARRKVQERG